MPTSLSFADTRPSPIDYLPPAPEAGFASAAPAPVAGQAAPNVSNAVGAVITYLQALGLVYEPWQVAAYVTAVRTKPFVVLAGISGTGKTKMPRIVAEATGAEFMKVPVRPDWTDSSELLGYERINGDFVPGVLLRFAKQAMDAPEKQFFFLLDEMNVARVEHYFAEILSHIEERRPNAQGRVVSEPLLSHLATGGGPDWRDVRLPDNLCIVGAVNMDETTHGFSKKVLDRAFVIEFSDIELSNIRAVVAPPPVQVWKSSDWRAAALTLGAHPRRNDPTVGPLVDQLITINGSLERVQLQFGYRLRDEVIMFCLAADQCREHFVVSGESAVAPFDVAVGMKILPRIQGGGLAIKKVLLELGTWAAGASAEGGSPNGARAVHPFSEKRISMMTERLNGSGFTSYWL